MFRPCILAIVRFYCKLNKQLYNMCVGCSGENEISFYITHYCKTRSRSPKVPQAHIV